MEHLYLVLPKFYQRDLLSYALYYSYEGRKEDYSFYSSFHSCSGKEVKNNFFCLTVYYNQKMKPLKKLIPKAFPKHFTYCISQSTTDITRYKAVS